jgi:hypothetical protein
MGLLKRKLITWYPLIYNAATVGSTAASLVLQRLMFVGGWTPTNHAYLQHNVSCCCVGARGPLPPCGRVDPLVCNVPCGCSRRLH